MTRERIGSIILRPFQSRLRKLQWDRNELIGGLIWARNPHPPISQRHIDRMVVEGGDLAAAAIMRFDPNKERQMIEESYPRLLVEYDQKIARLEVQIGFIKRILRL